MAQKTTLHIAGVDDQVDEKLLNAAFITFGPIVSIQLPSDSSQKGNHKGFAFIEFEEVEDAQAAVDNMNNSELYGRVIKVNFARSVKGAGGQAVWGEESHQTKPTLQMPVGLTQTEPMQVDQPTSEPTKERPRVFFDVNIRGQPAGRLVMELRGDIVPKTVANFLSLCKGDRGLTYKKCLFHRIIPGFMCQGGDIENLEGRGGKSIYGGSFADENFRLRHDGPGVLSMANAGPNTNKSQFFITFGKTDHLDGKHVVFGRVVEGMEVLRAIEKTGSSSGKPSSKVSIQECGEYLE